MPFQRISARRGQIVDLSTTFVHGGIVTDPYAIRRIEIYRSQITPHNLVETIDVVDPCDPSYPSPISRVAEATDIGDCGTIPDTSELVLPGQYIYEYMVPIDAVVPDIYYDVWYYYPVNPCTTVLGTDCTDGSDGTCASNIDDELYSGLLLSSCNRFWVYPDNWFVSDGLQTVRYHFEPLDQKFFTPEARPLEVGIMPLPLYDYNFNLAVPIIPYLSATIRVETKHCELVIDDEPMTIGLRQGSYRSNPYVLQWNLDTSRFLIGTYRYQVKLTLPDGSTRVSGKFIFVIQ